MVKPYQRTTIVPRDIKFKELISLAEHNFVPQVALRDLPLKKLYRVLQYEELAADMKLRYPTTGDGAAYSVLLMDYCSKQKPRPRLRVITPERYGSAIATSHFLVDVGMATSASGRDYHKISMFNVPDYQESDEEGPDEDDKGLDKVDEKRPHSKRQYDGMCVVEPDDKTAYGYCGSCGERSPASGL